MTNLPVPNLFGTARDKAELFRERYSILQQVRNGFVLFKKIREQNAFSFFAVKYRYSLLNWLHAAWWMHVFVHFSIMS